MPEMGNATRSSLGKERFLITGAKGFIGAWIVKRLVERGERAWIFDRDKEAHRLRALLPDEEMVRLPFIQGDITDFEEVEHAVVGNGITHIIHLAAVQVPTCAANPLLGGRINVIGTLNVFEAARRRRDTVKRVVYASSAAVFGPEEMYGGTTVPEGAPLEPRTHYGVFKQCNEGNARVFYLNDGISSVGLRPGAVYGVGRDIGITSGPTKAIKAAVAGRDYAIKLTGKLDLQYARDTADIFLRCAEVDLPGARVYTLRGAVTRMDDFIRILQQELPQSRGRIRAEGPALPIACDFDDSALVRDLGVIPRTSLLEGIRETRDIFERLHAQGRLGLEDLET